MIRAYSKIPSSQESLHLFHRMLVLDASKAVVPDNYTFTFVITSCSHQNLIVYGEIIHGQVIKSGFESDIFVGNSLVNMYSVFVKMNDSQKLFDEMLHRDVFTWTSLLGGYIKLGEMGTASELFSEMPERNNVSWAVMIAGYVSGGRYTAALRCFHDMFCDDKVKPNEMVLVCVLSACAHIGALDQGEWIHAYIDRTRVRKSSNISTALIDMYAKCGRIGCATQAFNAASDRNVLTWTSMITGLSIHGLGKDALQVFSQMVDEGLKPNNVTLVGVLNGCSHSGLVDEGLLTFHNMESLWGISPTIEHYGCLIDLLGRAGHLERAFEIAKSMPMKPDVVIWRALLSACRVHGDVCLGEQIMDHIAQLDHISNSGGHVLLSNLYASLGQWESVVGVRKVMIERGKKETSPGFSWIEVCGIVHEFRIDDQLHPQIVEIHCKLREMLRRAAMEGGYVANARKVSFDLLEEEKEQAVSWHSEKLAIAFGLMKTEARNPIRIVKNLRTCEDCHSAIKAICRVYGREIIVRDRSRFHTFKEGSCSCKDYW
ncbi:pentatricopeptide repeat-containing protein At5g66520-like [Macadamia integrifolia]|uniref:pentatricopeptide repeat-containing protein At5g66520-like n=1 Tax=Macadamia integrifolia TaxID=60698 RepID=UPI001C4E45C8|nr:pentatricopeptide repeat-containing protein At5g66520-like [Macadamia integrifolia]